MISFIIPTLWKSDCIYNTIDSFLNSSLKEGSEIIIIDNSNSSYTSPDEKYVKVIKMEQNIFVNPSWNLGTKLAKNNNICLLNDDINFNIHTFLFNFKKLVIDNCLDYGMIAINAENFNFDIDLNLDSDLFELEKFITKGSGFGMMMIIKKEDYEFIPEDFKIYFGDDILWLKIDHILKKQTFYFKNLKIKGQMSVTSRSYESEYLQEENKYWDYHVKKILNKYGFN